MSVKITEYLANYIVSPGQIPASARDMMRLSLLDWSACAIAGVDEPVAGLLRAQGIADAGTPQASVVGAGVRLPAKAAAMINGTTSHALDYDDTHFAHIGHPSVAVVPAALAVGEMENASGADILDAALMGAEVSIRVGIWLGRAHYQTGFHQTATAGAFGATAAAARLLGLDVDRTCHAIGLTATRASGLKSQFGTMGKPHNAGIAAANGVECALLAQAGFVANPAGLETDQGFGPTHAGMADATALDGLGQSYHFETVSHKFHACCHGTHAALEALATLLPRTAGRRIQTVNIATHPRWMTVCNIAKPQTGLEAKFSYRLTAAMALSALDTGALDVFSDANCLDPALIALRDKVKVDPVETLPETAASVCIRFSDGTSVSADHDLDAALPLAERQTKLMAKAAAIVGKDTASQLWHAISQLNGPDATTWTKLLRA